MEEEYCMVTIFQLERAFSRDTKHMICSQERLCLEKCSFLAGQRPCTLRVQVIDDL